MKPFSRIAGAAIGVSAMTAVLVMFVVPGCFRQNQDNSPISINNSTGRPMLSVTCSQDGSIAYVADGRNIYRYERHPAEPGGRWECILSYGERLELAAEHDSREQALLDDLQEKTSDVKPSAAAPENKGR